MSRKVLMNGAYVEWDDATVHISTHALHYGTAVFEGIRAYYNDEKGQSFIFRLREHVARLYRNMRVLRLSIPLSAHEFVDAAVDVVRQNELKEDVYIRPIVYWGAGAVGLYPFGRANEYAIYVEPMGMYFADVNAGLETDGDKGLKTCVSSWARLSDNSLPPTGKFSGAYVNSVLAKVEAVQNGYDEALLLTKDGFVSEGSGENVFLVRNGTVLTPPVSEDILEGITRDAVITLCADHDYRVIERRISRSELYSADELFFTGTAGEVAPITSVDGISIGNGAVGRITHELKDAYFNAARGNDPHYSSWLTPVF
ncbi:MAG TPA: branched-chain amino acid transaminase [Candidatus Bathyarchaeia archaeon]|nr:branched-chain amino acid transaminase [Candidatus Bathyarchaeia archaeon]